jgi:hypothetical protein
MRRMPERVIHSTADHREGHWRCAGCDGVDVVTGICLFEDSCAGARSQVSNQEMKGGSEARRISSFGFATNEIAQESERG